MIIKADYHGSPHIGLFCVANDNIALIPNASSKNFEESVRQALKTETVKTSLVNTHLLGIFAVANNKRIIVPALVEKQEVKTLEDFFSDVIVLDTNMTAIGNLVAMNDHGTACSRFLIKNLKEATGIKVAGSDLVGSALFANNQGFIAHRDAKTQELKTIEKILKVQGTTGTTNFGNPFVKSGIVANKHGLLVGNATSGPELDRISDIFLK